MDTKATNKSGDEIALPTKRSKAMKKVFSVYQTDKSIKEDQRWVTVLHGRALAELEVGNELTSDHSGLAMKIIKIVTYGHSLERIEASMGCALTVVSDSAIHSETLWLFA